MLSKKKDIWIVISLCVLAFYIIFMIYPLGILFKNAVIENNGNFTFAYFSKFLSKNYYFSTIFNSFKVSLAATALTLFMDFIIRKKWINYKYFKKSNRF